MFKFAIVILVMILPALAHADGTISGWARKHGNIYPLHPVTIQLLDPVTGEAVPGLSTVNQEDGTYELSGIPEGNYKVYYDAFGEADHYIDELAGNIACDNGDCDRVKLGTVVHIDDGINSLNASIREGAMIRGTVTDMAKKPLAGVTVEFFDNEGRPYCCTRQTGADGTYERPVNIFSTFYALARFTEPSSYQPQAFGQVPCSGCDVGATSTPFFVETRKSGINFKLPRIEAPSDIVRDVVDSQKFSGSWFVPERSGEGFIVEILDHPGPNGEEQAVVVFWFTYTPDGRQAWMVGNGGINGGVAEVDFEITDGASFGAEFNAEQVSLESWGSIRFDFLNCERAQAEYAGEFGSGQLTLTRLTAIHGLDCADTGDADVSGNSVVSGAWFNPARSGEGFIVETVEEAQILTYWFTYDSEGRQMWLLGVGDLDGGLQATIPMQSTSGGRFGDAFDPESVVVEDWGSVTFEFGGCDDAFYGWDAPAPWYEGGFELIRLTALKNISC